MTVVITGGAGQLGRALSAAAADRGIEHRVLGRAELDVTDPDRVAELPLAADAVLINCAAYTAVDAAESDFTAAAGLNASAPDLLARRCRETGARLIQLSTDYVFGPAPTPPRPRRTDDPTDPRTAYGATKLAGEIMARGGDPRTVVVRTAWLYTGPAGTGAHPDFVATMARFAADGTDPKVVDDQVGSPTYAPDLAAGLLDLAALLRAEPERPGTVVHAAGAGSASWFDLARAVFIELGADPERVRPCASAEYPRPAPRPAYSVLDGTSWTDAGPAPLPDWHDGVRRALAGAAPTDR